MRASTLAGSDANHLPPLLKENHAMALRSKTITKVADLESPSEEQFSQRKRPETGRYRLQVDRQTKASFPTYDAAEKAGIEIKSRHPVVHVAVYDATDYEIRVIKVPAA